MQILTVILICEGTGWIDRNDSHIIFKINKSSRSIDIWNTKKKSLTEQFLTQQGSLFIIMTASLFIISLQVFRLEIKVSPIQPRSSV